MREQTLSTLVSTNRRWIIAPRHPDCLRLAQQARVAPVLAQVFLNRQMQTPAQIESFLAPDWSRLLPPESLPGVIEAARLLADAARRRRRIVIYGDYDVDGITATAILWHVLTAAGADVRYFIPNRFEEGYGLSADALATLKEQGADVVVTVDCGITACQQARRAAELGLQLIITDHHEPGDELPEVAALVHPSIGAGSDNPHLCGAGVAFKLAWALARELCGREKVTEPYRTLLVEAVGLTALGLVADVVPLIGENRIIAAMGLRQLRHTSNVGLAALIEVSGLSGRPRYNEYDIGFALAPRLNALGRLGHAIEAVELFTSASEQRAREIAQRLDQCNRQRQRVEREIAAEAVELVRQRGFDRAGTRGIVLASERWNRGVVGIVASRLVERFGRPAVLIALDGDEGQGSGRSVPNFPLHEVLTECREHLISHGGHAMAAGLRIAAGAVEGFTQAFLEQAARRLTDADLLPALRLDDELELGQLDVPLAETLERMAPFGIGNPRPRFATTPVELVGQPRTVGGNARHLQFVVRQGQVHRKAIAFGAAERLDELLDCGRLRLAFEPIVNEWNGRRSAELKVLDFLPAD